MRLHVWVLLAATAAVVGSCNQPAQAGLVINATYDDASFTAGGYNPTDVHDAFNYVISEFQNLFTDNISININVEAGNVGLGQSTTFLYGKFDYSQIQALLTADQTTGSDNTAVTNLTNPGVVGNQFWLSTAEAKALGLNPGNSSDGTFTFSNAQAYTFDPNNRQVAGRFDWIGVAEHEVSEIMGRISLVGSSDLMLNDLFRYTGPGAQNISGSPPTNVGLSIDGGNTILTYFANSLDFDDYRGDLATDPFNQFTSAGQGHSLSSAGITHLDVIGYDLRANVVPEPASLTLFGLGALGLAGAARRRRQSA